jgi:hypothetical protein
MKDVTAIYYTSNREKEEFEAKIRKKLLGVIGNTPLISVSQKPIDFGENICVGDVGTSDHNIYRQIQIACQKAKTKFVCTTEADCLYPPKGYFDYNPPVGSAAYHYMNVWILLSDQIGELYYPRFYKGYPVFRKKAFSLCALFTNRKYLLSRIERSIGKRPQWSGKKPRPIFHRYKGWTPFTSKLPVINIKTKEGMRRFTGTEEIEKKILPHWGSATKLQEELWT